MNSFVTAIKQHPDPIQVTRRVKVCVPGKHFPSLQPAEQAQFYEATACQYKERHKFPQHLKAWGAEHTGPGIRFLCDSDALKDPDHKGFWTTLLLWNRWRHETFPNAELQYLDRLPNDGGKTPAPAAATANGGTKAEKAPPAIVQHFKVVSTDIHIVGGKGRWAGSQKPVTSWACNQLGCWRDARKPIPEIGKGTGQLFRHLEACQPELCKRLRADSSYSPVEIDDDGNEYVIFAFDELLPHHALFVQKCFRGFDHFYESRANNGLAEWVRSFEKRAALPCAKMCEQLLEVYEELVYEKLFSLIKRHKDELGTPCAGSTTDIWSLKSYRESFACMRGAFVFDGDMVAQVTGDESYKGKLVDCSPILAFRRLTNSHHTGAVIANWKQAKLKVWNLLGAIGLATAE